MNIRFLVPQKLVNYIKHLPQAFLALIFYRFPSRKLKIVGVTGTDGKTTTVSLIYHILKESGAAVAMVSTVSAKIENEEINTGFHVTAPDPWQLQKLLQRMVEKKLKYAVLEITSHGLDQFRDVGIFYEVGVITNVTHEHLDYHKTYKNYLEAKAKLLRRSKVAVLNRDDESYEYLETEMQRRRGTKMVTYGIKNKSDFTLENFPFKTRLPGEYNLYNCLAAVAAASILGVSSETIRKAVFSFQGVAGRMEEITEGQSFRVIVDFAHTPNALKQVLGTLRENLKNKARLIVVFGAAGLRDKGKRPLMGKVAGQLADIVVLTAEDPRSESAEDICQEISAGCREAGVKEQYVTAEATVVDSSVTKRSEERAYLVIPDRQEAINYAICNLAKKGDIVVVCGKGHEKSMCFGITEYPWSDQEAVKKALKERKSL